MGNDSQDSVTALLRSLGGAGNIVSVTNCMTRLRVSVKTESDVSDETLRSVDGVMGVVHDRPCSYEIVVGPGKSRKYADRLHEMGCSAAGETAAGGAPGSIAGTGPEWKKNKEAVRTAHGSGRIRSALKIVGDIFVPLIPGIICAGLCAGFASLITQLVPDYADRTGWSLLYQLLTLVNMSFMTYMTAWAGYRAAERFGATPILGGMLGMITSLDGINQISMLLGLYNEESPLNSILRSGKGGVLAVITGVFLLSVIEKKIRSRMPESLDIILTPLLSLLVCVIPYILIIMPLLGWVSGALVWGCSKLCMSEHALVRIIAGYASTAVFLPLVAAGMHHGFVALYSVQLQELGYVTLYPALAMAGAGQVGTAIALWLKAGKVGNRRLRSVIAGALPAGILGVGEPLIYGVTLPLGRPFITAGLGAGFGGALVMAMKVAATTWGPSGLPGVFVMTAGPLGAVKSALFYLAGLGVSYICSFLITMLAFDSRELEEAQDGDRAGHETANETGHASAAETELRAVQEYPSVRHGDMIFPGETASRFRFRITDPAGIHARPAGKLVQLAGQYGSKITVSANGRSASAGSVIELMNLGAAGGTVLTVTAEGDDSAEALKAVREFMQQNLQK
ncbi:MAG: HPr family phosphocarrier protein [Lachnospiraceae bacterium]|nr:HPr family phosphocarrier protein [Lachnospiraceae bacterium]